MPRTRRRNKGRKILLAGNFLGAESLSPPWNQSRAGPNTMSELLDGLASGLGKFSYPPNLPTLPPAMRSPGRGRSVCRRASTYPPIGLFGSVTSGVELRVLCDSCLFPFAFELRFTRFTGACLQAMYCLQAMAMSGIACNESPASRLLPSGRFVSYLPAD